MFVARPCSTSRAVYVTPEGQFDIDLEELCECLKEKGFVIKRVTPHIAILRKEYEISVLRRGKIIVKGTTETEEALRMAREIYECMKAYGW